MSLPPLRFRQVHLDFHTGPAITGVGRDFEPQAFAETLAAAHVDSITCFARCHHGYLYYNSRRNPERLHPHLTNPSLLLEQINACHEVGIRVPIYTTVQWDAFTAQEHAEWLCVDDHGRRTGPGPFEPGFYQTLDVYHPGYREFLREHVREIMTTLPVDGLFFDICSPVASAAPHWIRALTDAGRDPADAAERLAFARRVLDDWELEMSEFVRSFSADCTIFYNSGHIGPAHRKTEEAFSHYELESLPSGGWGYLHFPQAMRYGRTLGKPCLGMTGKFHTSWGDFSSYKNEAALEFECFNMLAHGARCSVGDQLPPGGELDAATYELIGGVYEQVAAKEPWCVDAVAQSEIAVFSPEAFRPRGAAATWTPDRNQPSILGAVRMLSELQQQFDIVDGEADLSGYRLVILPDSIPLDEALAARLADYLQAGGAVLASHNSGLATDADDFALAELGVRYLGDAPLSPDFLVPGELLADGLAPTAYVMYQRATLVEPLAGARVLATTQVPFHNRTWRTYCSHAHTPNCGREGGPAIVATDRCIYFAHPVFTMYQQNAPRWCKQLVANAIAHIMPAPLLTVDGPSSLLAMVNEQPAKQRQVIHLLHYIPERRGQQFDVIEDVIPLFDLRVRLRSETAPQAVRLVPDDAALDFTHDGSYIEFVVPRLDGHAMVEVS